jgi:DNA-binding transcriptional regulator LsrR (DeoR family)
MRNCYHPIAPLAEAACQAFRYGQVGETQEKMNPLVRSEGHATRLHAVTAVLAARRYFLDGASKSEIAQELGISRFKVARLLDDARRDGIVRIEIGAPPEIDLELSTLLAARYRLTDALVVRTMDGPDEFKREQLGRACAQLLTETLEANDVLGISWGRTLHSMVGHLSRLPACAVVQIVGSVPTLELDVNSMEVVRRVADCADGPVYPLPVPLLVDSPEMAAALRSDPHVHKTIAMFDQLTEAVVGIGAWTASGSTVRSALPEELAAVLDAAGAVADVCSNVLDASGREIRAGGLPGRLIAITPDQLRAVPNVVAVAGGAQKAPAILAALRSGLIHQLITDEEAARLLLAQ